jgi:hypothetical protein
MSRRYPRGAGDDGGWPAWRWKSLRTYKRRRVNPDIRAGAAARSADRTSPRWWTARCSG